MAMGSSTFSASAPEEHPATDGKSFSMPTYHNGTYENPFKSWRSPTASDVFKLVRQRNKGAIPKTDNLDEILPVIKPDAMKLATPEVGKIQCTWIGHATCLVQMDGINVLTDPIFSDRCSPVQCIGTKRYRPPALMVQDLPPIDAVVISHNHYDHLDYGSVCQLHKRFGRDIHWFVGKGLKSWFTAIGCENVTEMTWWQEEKLMDKDVKFVFVPAQHWCRRALADANKALWGGWAVIGPTRRFYFAGDTGYCEAFQQIGSQYGEFDLAAIPIGAYCPKWFMAPAHVDPEQAVKVHMEVKSKHSIGIHWGTFKLGFEPYMEPKTLLQEQMEKMKGHCDTKSFKTYHHGETFSC